MHGSLADKSLDIITASMECLKTEMAAEDDRNKRVEAKLQSLLGLNTAGIGIITTLVTLLTANKETAFPPRIVLFAVAIAGYVALQLFRAVWASVRGLERRHYAVLTIEVIDPTDHDADVGAYYARLYSEMRDCLRKNYAVIDDKVDQMALAHTAVLNATFALALLVLLVIILYVVL